MYEDKENVYLVMEMCRGPTLEQKARAADLKEADVSGYMRSVVRTIAQCHDKDEPHGAVAAGKFMLLNEEREAPVKATGFGRLTKGASSAGAQPLARARAPAACAAVVKSHAACVCGVLWNSHGWHAQSFQQPLCCEFVSGSWLAALHLMLSRFISIASAPYPRHH